MRQSKISRHIDGEFWFSLRHAASCLGTTKSKIEMMAIREIVRSRDDLGGLWVAESDIARLGRDPEALKLAKSQIRVARVRKPIAIGGRHERGPDQHVLGVSDHRLPLTRKILYVED